MDLSFIESQIYNQTKYYTKILRFIWRYSDGDIRDVAILKNFKIFYDKRKRGIAPMAFITINDKKPIIFINKKDWPESDLSMCKAILLHEIGHYKTGLNKGRKHTRELNAHLWAMDRAENMYNKKIYRCLLLNLFLWGFQKNFDPQYRKASKLAHKRGIINRECLDKIFKGKPEHLDKTFEKYLKNIKSIRV